MKKIKHRGPFSEKELKLLRGNFKRIARKHKVSRPYVSYLATGKKPANNPKAKNIIADLRRLLAAYKTVL